MPVIRTRRGEVAVRPSNAVLQSRPSANSFAGRIVALLEQEQRPMSTSELAQRVPGLDVQHIGSLLSRWIERGLLVVTAARFEGRDRRAYALREACMGAGTSPTPSNNPTRIGVPKQPREGSMADKVLALLELANCPVSVDVLARELDLDVTSMQKDMARWINQGLVVRTSTRTNGARITTYSLPVAPASPDNAKEA